MAECSCRQILSEANIRRAFTERKPLSGPTFWMTKAWYDTMSHQGQPAVEAKFYCDLCGETHTVTVEIAGEPDPGDWWKN